jgi:XapX domain-containing protein
MRIMSYTKIIVGLLLSFVVGIACRLTHIPVPSPPVLSGALLVLMMSLGYWLVDRYCTLRAAANKGLCAGHALERK